MMCVMKCYRPSLQCTCFFVDNQQRSWKGLDNGRHKMDPLTLRFVFVSLRRTEGQLLRDKGEKARKKQENKDVIQK